MPNKNIHINICCDPATPLCAYYIQLGMEEEGVPSHLDSLPISNNIAEIAKNAAERSRLMVGVAVNQERIVIHHQKLPTDRPILSYIQNDKNARLVGKNAARLVKGLPFDLGEEL